MSTEINKVLSDLSLSFPVVPTKSPSDAAFPSQWIPVFSGSSMAVIIVWSVFETRSTCSWPDFVRQCPCVLPASCCWDRRSANKRPRSCPASPVCHHHKLSFTSCWPVPTRERRPCYILQELQRRFWLMPAVPVQPFANDLHSCVTRRKCVCNVT